MLYLCLRWDGFDDHIERAIRAPEDIIVHPVDHLIAGTEDQHTRLVPDDFIYLAEFGAGDDHLIAFLASASGGAVKDTGSPYST